MDALSPARARKLFRQILTEGELVFSQHALDETAKDGLLEIDCVNVIRGGVVEEPEFEHGSYRYRVHTQKICVVVALESEDRLIVVTAWRLTK